MGILEAVESFIMNHASKEAATLLLAMLPLVELKGAIPLGMALGLSSGKAFILSYIGSMVPVVPILLLIRQIFAFLKRFPHFKRLIEKIENRALDKSGPVKKYGPWGLLLFVGIPLPGTGVWMGSLIAVLMQIRIVKAFAIIALGNALAGGIIWALSFSAWQLYGG